MPSVLNPFPAEGCYEDMTKKHVGKQAEEAESAQKQVVLVRV